MSINHKSTLDSWDFSQSYTVKCSELYCLEPAGVGTPFVESLTSYITRLAEAHCVTIGRLIADKIVPASKNLATPSFRSSPKMVNGFCRVTKGFLQGLEVLTHRTDLVYLTMMTWANVMSASRMFKPYKSWCPQCFQDMKQKKETVYEPLIWSFRIIDNCSVHNIKLQDVCPKCSRNISLLAHKTLIGFCPYCKNWLGEQKADTDYLKVTSWQRWNFHNLGQLFEQAPYLPSPPSRGTISKLIKSCSSQLTNGNYALLAKKLQVGETTLKYWQYGTCVPQVDYLLKISYLLNTPLKQLLNGQLPPETSFSIMTPEHTQIIPRKIDYDIIKHKLIDILNSEETPFPSIGEISKRLCCSRVSIKAKFPELCNRLKMRYRESIIKNSEKRKREKLQRLREQTIKLFHEGVYPSSRVVSHELGWLSFTYDNEAFLVWRNTLMELGIEMRAN